MEEPSLEDYSCMLGRLMSCQSSSYSPGNTSRHLCQRQTRNRSKLSAVVWPLHLFLVDSNSMLKYLFICESRFKKKLKLLQFSTNFPFYFNREKPAMPSNVLSLIQLRTMPLHDQVKTLLTNGKEEVCRKINQVMNFYKIPSSLYPRFFCSASEKYVFSG